MDYYALSDLIMMSLIGLSILAVTLGFSVRAFIQPVVREFLGSREADVEKEQQLLAFRLEQVEERLARLETSVHRLAAAEALLRQLGGGEAGGTRDGG
jgi:hypothetical protein